MSLFPIAPQPGAPLTEPCVIVGDRFLTEIEAALSRNCNSRGVYAKPLVHDGLCRRQSRIRIFLLQRKLSLLMLWTMPAPGIEAP